MSGEGKRGERQRTLAGSAALEGTGLHSGQPVTAEVGPAEADRGIVFRRTDVDGEPEVPARLEHVSRVEWETVLSRDDVSVRTVEHLLAALAAHGVDNAEVRLQGPEPPALDGSAAPWCEVIEETGVREQDATARVLEIEEPLRLEAGESRYTVLPYDGYRVSSEIEFDHPAIGHQFVSASPGEKGFCREVAPARTFGLEAWREPLRERGLALGASHENTIVLTEDGLAEGTVLRFPDEFARHKLLDLVGDLVLVGGRLRAHVLAERPGHRGNVELARRLVREADRSGAPVLGIQDILEHMPHRYPFLLVDRILAFEGGRRIVGQKNVTINEPFFTGHFPDHPIMPGVLVVEAMAQAGGLLLMNEFDDPENKVVYLMSLDDVKFRRPVVPGDRLIFELEMLQVRGRVCRMQGVGRVDGEVVTEAKLLARVMDR